MFVCRVATLQIASLKMVPTASTEQQASRCYSINSSQHNINSAESVDLSLHDGVKRAEGMLLPTRFKSVSLGVSRVDHTLN